jgi:5-methylcytosine-specific restriction protein A
MAHVPDRNRNPNWTRDELILALELYLRNPTSPASKESIEVKRLSEELNRLQQCLGQSASSTLRNANGVYMKMMNFRRFDPAYISQGKRGMTHGNALEAVIWNEFSSDRERLAKTCDAIREALRNFQISSLEELDEDIVEAPEGRLLTRLHRIRERNKKLVALKKKHAMDRNGALACEVCGFDFQQRYGSRGEGFIECHHTKPVCEYADGGKTTIHHLALVCANCHRMIHSKRPWLTIEEIKLSLL